MILTPKNIKFFKSIIGSLSQKKKLTFIFEDHSLKILTTELEKIYINLEHELFDFQNYDDMKFTIDTKPFESYLKHFKTNIKLIIDDQLTLFFKEDDLECKFFITFVSLIDYEYEQIEQINTKCILSPSNVKIISQFKGIVTYEVENKKLILRRSLDEIHEEVEIFEIDFIETGALYFTCNNNWVDVFADLNEHIENVLFNFSTEVLSVQFLFKKYADSYMEIQVPRSILKH